MPPSKRRNLSTDSADSGDGSLRDDANGMAAMSSIVESISDTEDGIEDSISRQTSKRKKRVARTSDFGATLQSLLNTDAPSPYPLSLKPSISRRENDEKLEQRAKKVIQAERRQKEEVGRIKGVIEGWGGESERTLRKVAQRGVVKLFNVIQQSQETLSATAEEAKADRGSGKPKLPAPNLTKSKAKAKSKEKDNVLGRGKEMNKNDFFDIIKAGGIVSKV